MVEPAPAHRHAALDLDELSRLRGRLRAALVADALDAIGLRAQCLRPGMSPLTPGHALVGLAFPVQIRTVDSVPDVPYQGLLASLDAIGPGQVYVAATGGAPDVAIWGELVTTACLSRGAVGAVCDGHARDTALIRTTGFPVYCRGTIPYDSNGRSEVVGHNQPVTIDGVRIEAGDLIVADDDGVAVVPSAHVDETITRALAKADGESQFRLAVREGMRATDAFRTFGVL